MADLAAGPRTPMAMITGSLGSGKTTLLRRILATEGRRIAVLMNEFGEIAVDSRIIEGKSIRIVELAGGCVCCSLAGEFEAAVTEIIGTIAPEYLLVEATGVAESDALTYEVGERLPGIRLDSVVCIVDAWAATRHPAVGYAARTQIAAADILLVNKKDLVTPEELDEIVKRIRTYNETAALIETVRCEADIDLLLGTGGWVRAVPAGLAAGSEPFESFTFVTDRMMEGERFRELLGELPSSVFRAKGFVRSRDGNFLFNYVGGRTDFEEMPAERTEMVFIGPSVAGDRDAILERLRACEVR